MKITNWVHRFEDHGVEGERWTGPLLSRWLEQEYGIRYEKMQVYNILRKMGIKFKKGEGFVGV